MPRSGFVRQLAPKQKDPSYTHTHTHAHTHAHTLTFTLTYTHTHIQSAMNTAEVTYNKTSLHFDLKKKHILQTPSIHC